MNKVLAIVVAASVFLMVAVLLITMSSSSLVDFNNSVKNAKSKQICQAEVQRAQTTGEWSKVSSRCSDYVPQEESNEYLAEKFEGEIMANQGTETNP